MRKRQSVNEIEKISTEFSRKRLSTQFDVKMKIRRNCLNSKQTWRSENGSKGIQKLPYTNLIENSNVRDYSFVRRIHGQTMLTEKVLYYVENWKGGIISSKKIAQNIVGRLQNYKVQQAKMDELSMTQQKESSYSESALWFKSKSCRIKCFLDRCQEFSRS